MFMENKKIKNLRNFFISTIIAIFLSAILFIFMCNIFMYFIPPKTPDGHPVMPFKQIFLSGFLSIIFLIIFFKLINNRLKKYS